VSGGGGGGGGGAGGRVTIVCGVSGSGKSSVAAALAEAAGGTFLEGDSFHPAANIAAMAAGHPLDDAMRRPWLEALGDACARAAGEAGEGAEVFAACSALRRAYRDLLRARAPGCLFLLLDGPEKVIRARLEARRGHYMPPALLASQLATLERPLADEPGIATVPVTADLPATTARAHAALQGLRDGAV